MKKSNLILLLMIPLNISIVFHAGATKLEIPHQEIALKETSKKMWNMLKNDEWEGFNKLYNDLQKNNPKAFFIVMNSLNEQGETPFLFSIKKRWVPYINLLAKAQPNFTLRFNNKNYIQHAIDHKNPFFLSRFLAQISALHIDTNVPLADYVIDEYNQASSDTALWDTIKVLFNKSPRFERLTLFTAIEKNSQGFVEKLITDKPGLLTARHETTQQTPLHFTLVQKQNNIATYLLNTRPEDASTLLFQETESGNATVVKTLITLDPKLIGARNTSLATPLHIAIKRGHKDLITYLLDNGADPLAVDNNNQNTLAYARSPEIQDILKTSMAEYVATSAGKERIKTLLQQAIEENNTAVAKDLLTYGAHAETVIIHGRTPELDQTLLSWALTNNDAELASIAVRNGAYPNVTFGKNQDTPLHWAVRNENQELFDALLEKGAKVDQTNARKETPLQVARTFQRTKMIKDLINHAQTIHT